MTGFVSRLTRVNMAIIILFGLAVLGVSGIALWHVNAQLTGQSVSVTRLALEALVGRSLESGIPLSQAARDAASQIEANPQVTFAIFDDKGKLLAGDPSLATHGQQAAALVKMAHSELPRLTGMLKPANGARNVKVGPGAHLHDVLRTVNMRVEADSVNGAGLFGVPRRFESFTHFGGGYAIVDGNAGALSDTVRRSLILIAVLVLFAGVLSFYLTRRTAQHAVAPVNSVTGALRRFADGDFSRFTPTAEEHDAGELFSAYNAASAMASTAIGDRQRLEANMRQFVADAGHELRTPLTIIMGYIDVLNRGAIAEQALARSILGTMRDEGERMRGLIGKLLLLARLENVEPRGEERVDVAALARKIVESARPLANGAVLDVKADSPVYALADEAELREAIFNILDNAIKYASGTRIETTVSSHGGQAIVSVKDDGMGMTEDERTHAFERFFRGDNKRDVPGSGLGLAIARRTVERAQGTITLESAPRQGTLVTIRLPNSGA